MSKHLFMHTVGICFKLKERNHYDLCTDNINITSSSEGDND